MKRKSFKPKLRLAKGVHMFVEEDGFASQALLEFIAGMGYLLYESPDDAASVIISDKVITYGWLKKNARRFNLDVEWWEEMTDLDSRLNEELDEYRW